MDGQGFDLAAGTITESTQTETSKSLSKYQTGYAFAVGSTAFAASSRTAT